MNETFHDAKNISKYKARKMLPCQLLHSFWPTAGVQEFLFGIKQY